MNTNNKIRSTRNLIVFGSIVILGIGVIAAVLLAQQRTNQRSKAAASTSLSFIPTSLNTSVGQPITTDINLDPGNNQVSILKLVIDYDGSIFDQTTANIVPNLITQSSPSSQGFVQVLQPFSNSCNGTSCTMSVTESIGSQANLVITQPLKVASISLKTIGQTNNSGTTVTIDQSSAAYSLAPSDQTNENVIAFSSLSPLTVLVGAGNGGGSPTPTQPPPLVTPTPSLACIPNQETCSWDSLNGAVTYNYTITDQTTGGIVSQGNIPASQTSVQFNATIGDTYQCSVTAVNACQANGNTASVTNTCPVIASPTPTNTPTPTPTPLASCNTSCTQNSNCQSGLICSNGVCANPACTSQSNCQCPQPTTPPPPPTQIIYVTQPPQVVYVTQPPQIVVVSQPPQKVLPPTGPGDILVRIGEVGAAIAIIGGLAAATGL